MDPKVYGELLTHHRRGNGVDEEALRIRIPPPAGHQNVPQMGSCGDRSLRRRKSTFDELLIFLGFLGNLLAQPLGQGTLRGPTSLWVAAYPPGRGVGACGAPEAPLPWLPSFPIFFHSKKNLFGDFLPFGLRFKISSEMGQKHGKNRNWHLALSQ